MSMHQHYMLHAGRPIEFKWYMNETAREWHGDKITQAFRVELWPLPSPAVKLVNCRMEIMA